MYCLRCGRDTNNDRVFCKECLDLMEEYPVKPGTAIQLPRRTTNVNQKRQNRRRALSPEEQVVRLKVTSRTLFALLCTVLVAFGVCLWLYFGGYI